MIKQYERSIFVIVQCPRRFRAVVVLSVCLYDFISETKKKKKEYLSILTETCFASVQYNQSFKMNFDKIQVYSVYTAKETNKM
jgi:hypothetical protein